MREAHDLQVVEVEFEGKTHISSFYIRNDMIYAEIKGLVVPLPCGNIPAETRVKALLLSQLKSEAF